MANEELLRKSEYLGQYGKIGKVVVHRNHTATQTTVSAYVTFVYKEDAKAAIQSLVSIKYQVYLTFVKILLNIKFSKSNNCL